MASSCLSNDKRNFQCVAVASVDLIKLPLRDILANHIKPTDLFQKIKSCSTLNLRQEQLKICLVQPPDYNSFDVSLLYTLIRNLCSLPSPAQGWGKEPKATDTQISDDIERLRLFRNNFYAHAESAGISESMFKDIWRNLRLAINRIQSRCNVNYEDELIRIEQSKYTLSHWEESMTLLNAYASKQMQTDGRDEPDIFIQGENEIICGGTARFKADVKNIESSCWSITWQKRRGDVIKCIDTNMERYIGSTKNAFVINSVSKEDEGEYQAVLSLESNGPDYKSRNTIRLHAIGEIPYVNILGVASESEGITIHYKSGVLKQSPEVHQIEWTKNGQQLDNNGKKYVGGGVQDSCFTIKSPTNDDRGNYSCKLINAVGSVSTTISLDIPSVEIFIDSPVCFGSETTIKSVVSKSMPTPEKIEWQKSKDGVDFNCIRYAKYPQSTNNSICPSFVINKTSFDDKRYYRLLVWNGIGKGVSNTVYLNVTGSPPNFTTSVDTNIKNRSVKLIGKLYFFDDSPGILETFWTKDDEKINTKESDGKLLDISNDFSSLIITNVSPDDAGDYQLTAINAVGSSTSDVMVLGVPSVFVKRVECEKNGSRRISVTIKSLPAPCHIQWSAKTKDDDSFTPIDINAEEYKGTMVSFPHPVLVVTQKDQLEKKCYQIEVTNFIGKTVQDISGNIKSTVGIKDIVENTFYKDRGARVRFTKLSNILAKQFPSQKLENLKFALTNSNIVQNRTSAMEATSALECIRILQDEELFTQTDVIVMQFLCTQTDCLDLCAKCVEYAEQQNALCYFEKPPVNGYKNAQFHVQGDISNYTKQYIKDVIETVAAILDCKEEDILLNGIRHSKSYLLSLSIKEVHIGKFQAMYEQDRLRLIRLDIDYLIIDEETIIPVEGTKDGTSNGQINAVVDTNAIDYIVERHSPHIGPNCRSDSHHPLNAENADVKQIQEDNTGNICSPFPNSDSSSPHSEGMLNPALTLEENPGVRNFPLDVSLLPTDSLSNGDIVQTQNSGENEDFLEEMQLPMVQNILETGVDRNTVMQKIKRRARERGDNYQNADDLLNFVLSMDRNSDSVNTHAMHTIPSLPLNPSSRNQHTSNTGYDDLDIETQLIVAQHLEEEHGSVHVNPEFNSHHSHSLTVSDHQIGTVRDLMESPIVQTALSTGVDRNSVMQAIEKRFRETGDTYSNAEDLLNVVLTLQHNSVSSLQDNQEIIAQIQPPMIEAVLDTGVDWNSVMQVIQRKLIETGENYQNAEDLLNDVLILEQNHGTHNILPNPDYEDDYIAAMALEENQGSDFIPSDTIPSPSDPYTSSDILSSSTLTSDHQMDTGVNRADLQQPIVLAVLDTGVDRNIVKIVIERRLRETGENFHNVQELMHAVLDLESNTGSSNVPQSVSRLHVPLAASPGNVSFRTQAAKLAEENRQLRQQKDCKICFNSEMGVVFLPCGHLCCCQTCATEVPHCPVCRANIHSTVLVFIS